MDECGERFDAAREMLWLLGCDDPMATVSSRSCANEVHEVGIRV